MECRFNLQDAQTFEVHWYRLATSAGLMEVGYAIIGPLIDFTVKQPAL